MLRIKGGIRKNHDDWKRVMMMPKPVIDQKKCALSKTCMDVCPMEVFAEQDGKMTTPNADKCIGCKACEVQCPEGAIKVED